MIIVPKPTSAIDISMSMLTIFSYGSLAMVQKLYIFLFYLLTFHMTFHKFLSGTSMLCCSNVVVVPLSLNPFIEFRIRNNSSSSDVLYIQASISISPKYESKSKTTSHCCLLLHDCTNVAV